MSWRPSFFSAKQAWRKPVFRWMSLGMLAVSFVSSGYFFWKLLPMRREQPTFVMHYNLYLGIDRLGPWSWVWLWPLLWIGFLLLDLVLAFGWYERDPILAKALLFFACAWSAPWILTLFYLIRVNS